MSIQREQVIAQRSCTGKNEYIQQDANKNEEYEMSVCSLYVKCQHVNVKLLPQRWVMKLWMAGLGKYLKEN